jgi:hypothetical protein
MAIFAALYGFIVYVFFLATFIYAIGFAGNPPLLPKTTTVATRHRSSKHWSSISPCWGSSPCSTA